MVREKIACCRICAGQCVLRFTLDDGGAIVRIVGDKANAGHPRLCLSGFPVDVEALPQAGHPSII